MSITNSRYDFMKEGTVEDSMTGSLYPDPLTLEYSDFRMSSIPMKNTLSEKKIMFLWKEAEMMYGRACWDDMVLTLNGIPHRNFLNVGDVLYFPVEDDIRNSFSKER